MQDSYEAEREMSWWEKKQARGTGEGGGVEWGGGLSMGHEEQLQSKFIGRGTLQRGGVGIKER